MAIDLPTSRLTIYPSQYQRTRPILSGDAAADKAYGWRGLVSQANHAYGYRVQTIAAASLLDSDTVPIKTNASALAYADLTGVIVHHLGADVAAIEAILDCEQTTALIHTDEGDGASGTQAARGVLTITYALVDKTGVSRQIQLQWKARAGGVTAKIYRWILREVILTGGDIP